MASKCGSLKINFASIQTTLRKNANKILEQNPFLFEQNTIFFFVKSFERKQVRTREWNKDIFANFHFSFFHAKNMQATKFVIASFEHNQNSSKSHTYIYLLNFILPHTLKNVIFLSKGQPRIWGKKKGRI